LTSGTTPFENLISPFTHNTKENRKILFDQTILLFDSFSSAVRTTNNNSTGKVVIPLGKFQNKWGPVRYDAAGTTGQRKIWWLGLSNIARALRNTCISNIRSSCSSSIISYRSPFVLKFTQRYHYFSSTIVVRCPHSATKRIE